MKIRIWNEIAFLVALHSKNTRLLLQETGFSSVLVDAIFGITDTYVLI